VKKTRRLRFSGRDYAFMFVNMVTDDFAYIGTRATGTEPVDEALVGPGCCCWAVALVSLLALVMALPVHAGETRTVLLPELNAYVPLTDTLGRGHR